MKTVFCKCRQCRLHRGTRTAQASIRRAKRHVRTATRIALKRGDDLSLPFKALAGYLA